MHSLSIKCSPILQAEPRYCSVFPMVEFLPNQWVLPNTTSACLPRWCDILDPRPFQQCSHHLHQSRFHLQKLLCSSWFWSNSPPSSRSMSSSCFLALAFPTTVIATDVLNSSMSIDQLLPNTSWWYYADLFCGSLTLSMGSRVTNPFQKVPSWLFPDPSEATVAREVIAS